MRRHGGRGRHGGRDVIIEVGKVHPVCVTLCAYHSKYADFGKVMGVWDWQVTIYIPEGINKCCSMSAGFTFSQESLKQTLMKTSAAEESENLKIKVIRNDTCEPEPLNPK